MTQALASLKRSRSEQLTTQSLAQEPEKDMGDDGYDFVAMRAANGGKLPVLPPVCRALF